MRTALVGAYANALQFQHLHRLELGDAERRSVWSGTRQFITEFITMQIQTNTDRNISGHDSLALQVEKILERLLGRFSDRITRVEAHLSDENGSTKSGVADKRCLLEFRLAGQQPVSVSEQAQTVDTAVTGTAHKMISLLDSELGKLRQH